MTLSLAGPFVLVACVVVTTVALDNGLARSPPLGWISSERFACNVDCTNYPDDCISERLVRTTADAMAADGFLDIGYKYVILGDCWMNQTAPLAPDSRRFPSGLQALADYVHQKGLLFGVQIELGKTSANGYPGCYGACELAAKTAAGWGVDYVHATAHSLNGSDLESAYTYMGLFLNHTGRPIVYSCDWAAETRKAGRQVDYRTVADTCNLFTSNSDVMVDSWESLESTIKFFAANGRDVVNFTGPGAWHTPNPLLVGDYGLSGHEQFMQMAVWSLMAAPLLVSADLRHLRPEQSQILLGKGTLAIDQDPLYKMGTEIKLTGQVHVWRKPIRPTGSYALLFMYFNISGGPSRVSVIVRDLGLTGAEQFRFTDVRSGADLGVYRPWYTFDTEVDPVGSLLIRAEPLPPTVNIQG